MKAFMIVLGMLAFGPVQAAVIVGAWKPLFQGVEFAAGEADKAEARLQQVCAVRVDLRDPDVEFFTTPSNGERPLETTSETTSEFLEHHGLQVAINANFFQTCCSPGEKDLSGLAISRGEVVSPQVASEAGSTVLLLTRDNRASVVGTGKPISTEGVWTAIAGSGAVLIDGAKPTNVGKEFHTVAHPRTAVGVSKDGRYLILMTIDGRQAGYSMGATLGETGDWLARFGAHDGLNLDGGGSTAMVKAEGGKAVVLNHPSGAAKPGEAKAADFSQGIKQRSNGNNFGVRAKALGAERAGAKPE